MVFVLFYQKKMQQHHIYKEKRYGNTVALGIYEFGRKY